MKKMVYREIKTENLIYLLACALNNQKADLIRVSDMNLTEVFSFAEFHKIAACIAFALENIGIDDELIKPWKQAKSMSIRKNIILNEERSQIYNYMENNSIFHVSLKGIILQNLYPKFGMREMGDNDILYDVAYQEKMYEFMIGRGYRAEFYKKIHHDEYQKPPIYNIELHTSLFLRSKNATFFDYYKNIMDQLLPVEGKKFELRFSDEDFYIYNIAHSYHHYVSGGTGLRILTDCYVYIKAKAETLDIKYIENECEKLGIADYEQTCRNLALKLFSPDLSYIDGTISLTESENKLLERIIESGAYGRQDLAVKSQINGLADSEKNTKVIKMKYYFNRLFMPIESVKDEYPFFYHHKILLPFLFIYRVFRAATVSKDRIKSELKSVDNAIENIKK